MPPKQVVKLGAKVNFQIIARQPGYEVSVKDPKSTIYNEKRARKDAFVKRVKTPMTLRLENLPNGAIFNTQNFVPGKIVEFIWKPDQLLESYPLNFIVDDGVISVEMTILINVVS